MKKKYLPLQCLLSLLIFSILTTKCLSAVVDLSEGPWEFAVDPGKRGEALAWNLPPVEEKNRSGTGGWDEVQIPHDYLTDPRYVYTGTAWYRKSFLAPREDGAALVWRLCFDMVFQRCRVWLNGEFVGSHEGGYTPFEFPVGKYLKPGERNLLVLEVDNSRRLRALPGIRSVPSWENLLQVHIAASAAGYPWLNYGGLIGKVRLLSHENVWIQSQKVETSFKDDVWRLGIRAELHNESGSARSGELIARISPLGKNIRVPYAVKAGEKTVVNISEEIPADAVKPWSLESPQLYTCALSLDKQETVLESTFGFRMIETKNGRFLINGKPVYWAGANRARGHPVFGGIDTEACVDQDMGLMKAAGLRFARLQHTAPGKYLLDWADRNGMLLVLEVGMWGFGPEDMASEELRKQWKAEMRELVLLAQNHPSVVGWSLGNEYESWTEAGIAWTRDMAAFMKELDATRPVTFAALGRVLKRIKEGRDSGPHAFDYVDYISINYYMGTGSFGKYLDLVHARWPEKVVAITEFGLRADKVKDETERMVHFDKILAAVRERPWICNLSYWSFNDYRSCYPGTGADGYRRWGLVDEHRQPRQLYEHVRKKLANGLLE